jgi:hypothetical protein
MDVSHELQSNIAVQWIVKEQSQRLDKGESLYAVKSKLLGVKFKKGQGVTKPNWIFITNRPLRNENEVVEVGKRLEKQTQVIE